MNRINSANAIERSLLAFSKREGACLLWTGHITPSGYGVKKVGRTAKGAHRVAFETWVGPIPDGLEIDHLCGNRACIEPTHLEAVTHRENLRRSRNWIAAQIGKAECKRGHLLPDEPNAGGRRPCKACRVRREPCPSCGELIIHANRSRHYSRCRGAK